MTARPIEELAGECGVPQEQLLPFGRGIAKLSLAAVRSLAQKPRGKLVLVSAMSPTP
ncbi:MAG: formate--tetrahydrofolate ligase, partial [Myxococcota bacterium]